MFFRFEGLAQKQMAPCAFDTFECSPEGMLWRKPLALHESGSLDFPVSASNLRSKRQEQFIQQSLGKKVAHQLRPALDQDHLTLPDTVHRLQDRSSTERASALDCLEVDGGHIGLELAHLLLGRPG